MGTAGKKPKDEWLSLLKEMQKIGANIVDVKINEHLPENSTVVKGFIVFRGAIRLQEAAKILVPEEYEAFFLTQALVDERDMVTWQENKYMVHKIETIYNIAIRSRI